MSVYSEYRASRTSWGIGALGSVIVEDELDNDDGTVGVGISIGGEAACFVICGGTGPVQCGLDMGSNVALIYELWSERCGHPGHKRCRFGHLGCLA